MSLVSLSGRSASSACDSIKLIMLETGEIYLATTDIARDTYSVCQVLARAFAKGKFYLRCKDCGLAGCFIVEARSIVIEGCTQWKIRKVNLSFHCTRKTEGRNRHYTTKQLLWVVGEGRGWEGCDWMRREARTRDCVSLRLCLRLSGGGLRR